MVERSETLSAVWLKTQVVRNATPCGFLCSEAEKALCTLLKLLYPEDDGTMILRNVGIYETVNAE
jgi:hypothetical protein